MTSLDQKSPKKSLINKVKENPQQFLASVFSFVAPGVGQLYVGYPKKFVWQYALVLTSGSLANYLIQSEKLLGNPFTVIAMLMGGIAFIVWLFSWIETLNLTKNPKPMIPHTYNLPVCVALAAVPSIIKFLMAA